MNVLGISGVDRHAAAALAVDGQIVAAACEESFARVAHIGYCHTGGYPLSSIDACFRRAGVSLDEIDHLVLVRDQRRRKDGATPNSGAASSPLFAHSHQGLERALRARVYDSVDPIRADARQTASALADEDVLLMVLDPERGASATFQRQKGEFTSARATRGADQLLCAIQRVATILGLSESTSYHAVERLGSSASPDHLAAFERAMTWDPSRGMIVNDERFLEALAPLHAIGLAGSELGSPLNVRLQQDRQMTAASFCARVNALVVEMAGRLFTRPGTRLVGFGGALFSSSRLAAALSSAFGDQGFVAPVPEPMGRAIGAALDREGSSAKPLSSLALGPEFSESEIKAALENCRLEYLYEPDWGRLALRISGMLSRGTVVAWFQGPLGFGPRAVGTRSILCDPSNRYARENINRFLRHTAIDDPLPVAMGAGAIEECLEQRVRSPFIATDAVVKPQFRDRLRAALDHRDTIPVQVVTATQSPALSDVLQVHRERRGVPGLISTTLSGSGEPVACTPRDAVRTMFSSAIDALVIGRFLLVKDHWMLRSGAAL